MVTFKEMVKQNKGNMLPPPPLNTVGGMAECHMTGNLLGDGPPVVNFQTKDLCLSSSLLAFFRRQLKTISISLSANVHAK